MKNKSRGKVENIQDLPGYWSKVWERAIQVRLHNRITGPDSITAIVKLAENQVQKEIRQNSNQLDFLA